MMRHPRKQVLLGNAQARVRGCNCPAHTMLTLQKGKTLEVVIQLLGESMAVITMDAGRICKWKTRWLILACGRPQAR